MDEEPYALQPRESVCPRCNLVFWTEAGCGQVHD